MWNNVKTFMLLTALTALVVGAGWVMGGRTGLAIALGLAALAVPAILTLVPLGIVVPRTVYVLTPALLGTFVILLANALGAYATVYYLTTGNFNVLPIRIAAMVSGDISLDPNMASALAMVLVGLMAVITVAHQLLLKRSYHASR